MTIPAARVLNRLSTFRRPAIRTGQYYDATTAHSGVAATASAMTANRLYAIPIFLEKPTPIDRIALNVTVGAAGNLRFGAYRALAKSFAPGSLIIDAGEVTAVGAALKQATTVAVLPAGFSWLTVVSDVTPTVTQLGSQTSLLGGDAGSCYGHVYMAHTYGALPATFSASPTYASTGPRLWARAA